MIRPLRVVALDLSNAATAIAATHDSTGQPRLSVSTITGTALLSTEEQVDIIEIGVRRACGYGSGNAALGAGQPDVVGIEGTFSRPGSSDYPLHALHANVRQWLHRRRIPWVLISPATVKVWATGRGTTKGENKVTKRDVVAAIIATYGHLLHINPADDNQSDATAVLSLTLAGYGQPLVPVAQVAGRRAINVPAWPELVNS